MIHPGLVSISFRKLSTEEIIDQCLKHGLSCIEWGGDVHVPHGDDEIAIKTAELMHRNNLRTAAYGSYYRSGVSDPALFADVLRSAKLLGAPFIRVWAGEKGSADTTPEERAAIVSDLKRCTEMAAAEGISLSTEYHRYTLTDTNESAQDLIAEVSHPMFRTGWQPPNGQSFEYRMAGLQNVQPVLSTVHVFHWVNISDRRPLAEGRDDWQKYLAAVNATGRDTDALLEFVMDDSLDQLAEDAATLNAMLRNL